MALSHRDIMPLGGVRAGFLSALKGEGSLGEEVSCKGVGPAYFFHKYYDILLAAYHIVLLTRDQDHVAAYGLLHIAFTLRHAVSAMEAL